MSAQGTRTSHDAVRWLPVEPGAPAWRRFEIGSRGDRVVARLHVPEGAGRSPLALVLTADALAVAPAAGIAVASFDLPLLGTRRSPKWTERLEACLADGPASATDRALVAEFLTQAETDARAILAVLRTLAEVDGTRVGLLGIGPGAPVAARLKAAEPKLAACIVVADGLCTELAPERGDPAGGDDAPADAAAALAALGRALA